MIKEGLFPTEIKIPSESDIEKLPRVWLTGNEFPWNPKIFENEESTGVPSFWDGVSEFQTLKTTIFQIVDTITDLVSVKMTYNDFLANMLNYLVNNNTTHRNDPKNDENKVISAQTHIKKEDYKKLRPFLGWLPQETVK